MKNQNQKSSKGVMLTESQWERCDRLANEMGCRSRNAFIRDAIDFYCSWLEKDHSERFLTPALESVISAKIRDSEERINRNAELPLIRFHDLRHTFATHAMKGGVDAKTLSGLLGHTDASFTLDTYTHVTSDMQKNASDVVGRMMQNFMRKE